VAEEMVESKRRRKVISGEWTEAESHKLMKEDLLKASVAFPLESDYKIAYREYR